ncbi:replicative helicase loader/inhibitor [Ruminiclostridium josui]|uniref:replicative helicase loader/inhibitor n=1 Tax=Ruminiclostridium josui TaxID=1499 RepID=UPI0004679557|nr:replicative helicase loader/inhibitor [Ruminiclostridium josui]
MTMQETAAIMTILETAYPRFYANKTAKEKQEALNLWATLFADDNAKIVTEAVKSVICTLEFPPTLADIKKKIAQLTQPQTLSEMEAWELVLKSIKCANYRTGPNEKSKAQEMFENLPEICQQLVGSPNQLREWANIDIDVLSTVVQSNFIKSYRIKAQQIKEYSMLPESTKKLISDLSKKMLAEGGESNAND